MILENDNAKLHEIASSLLSFPYAWISGAYSVAFNHMKKAMILDSENIYYKELILFYHDIPDIFCPKKTQLNMLNKYRQLIPQ